MNYDYYTCVHYTSLLSFSPTLFLKIQNENVSNLRNLLIYTYTNFKINMNGDRRSVYIGMPTKRYRRNYGVRKPIFGSHHSNNSNKYQWMLKLVAKIFMKNGIFV